MATISLSSEAPKEGKVHFSFGMTDFDLGAGDTYKSDDPNVIVDANANIYLKVEHDPAPAADRTPEPAAKAEPVAEAPVVSSAADAKPTTFTTGASS